MTARRYDWGFFAGAFFLAGRFFAPFLARGFLGAGRCEVGVLLGVGVGSGVCASASEPPRSSVLSVSTADLRNFDIIERLYGR